MLLLNATEVRQALPMDVAIAAMKAAFAALSSGKVEMPLRTHLSVHAHNGVCLIMPAFVHEAEEEALVVKVVSVYPNNPTQGLSTIHGEVLVLDPGTGRLVGLLEGGTLTGIRTGAASGLATDLLARDDSHVVAIFGAGMQARHQLEAVCTVRPIKKSVGVFSPSVLGRGLRGGHGRAGTDSNRTLPCGDSPAGVGRGGYRVYRYDFPSTGFFRYRTSPRGSY